MPTYYISTVQSKRPISGRLTPTELADCLQRDWPASRLQPAASSADLWPLTWSVEVGTHIVRGRLFHQYYGLMLSGEREACLDMAAWYLDRIFAPGLFGRLPYALLSEHDGGLSRTVTLKPGITRQHLGQVLAESRFRSVQLPAITSCRISTIHTGTLEEGVIAPEAFINYLHDAWEAVQAHTTHDPYNPSAVNWEAKVEGAAVRGQLGRQYHTIWFSGPPAACAVFACWYRSLIPASYPLGFTDERVSTWVELLLETTPQILEQATDWILTHVGRVAAPVRLPQLPTILGGHCGQIAYNPQEMPFAVGELAVTPAGEVWHTDRLRMRVYRDQRWFELSAFPFGSVTGSFSWFKGKLWAAGNDGLVFYDGTTWQWHTGAPVNGRAEGLASDPAYLWISTSSQGIWRTPDGQHWEQIASPPAYQQTGELFPDGQGSIWTVAWIDQSTTALFRWRVDAWERVSLPTWRRYHKIHALFCDPDGTLWVGTHSGLWRLSGSSWSRVEARHADYGKLLIGSIRSISRDGRGRLWVAGSPGLLMFTDDRWLLVSIAVRPASDERVLPYVQLRDITSSWCDGEGRLWLTTRDHQVVWVDTTRELMADLDALILVPYQPEPLVCEPLELNYPIPPALPVPVEPATTEQPETEVDGQSLPASFSAAAPAVLQARAKRIPLIAGAHVTTVEIPGVQGSLMSFALIGDDRLWAILAPYGQLYSKSTAGWSLVELPDQVRGVVACWGFQEQLWVLGTGTEVLRYADGVWHALPREDWMGANPFSTTIDRSGRLWIGTIVRGLFSTADGGHWNQIALPKPLFVGPIWSDGAGHILLAELGKRPARHPIWHYRDGVWETIPLPTMRATLIFGLAMQQNGDLWIATSTGLWRRSSTTWERMRVNRRATHAGLPGEVISHLWVDTMDRVWACTDAGIAVYADGVWQPIAIARDQPIYDAPVAIWDPIGISPHGIHLDQHNRLWFAVQTGEIGYIDTTQPISEQHG